ncbi:hypothetical protein FR483_n075R [Paramecium bursaria Chlorella virus FR483]|uniref:Uncharacterized protein n075R n=1 Tax=Paramecium bursaria Chlorella virus FR483 TaxID=399781 RepID=A7J6C9_PBCVF|nr:hypothetical protein FR483_n075R [Paramecium bursaria Chlorella virus FR483]ABT15360.1 hypothetical protein FR483_n075R [Paramecium bursaria Chlorella virus FR483]
MEISSSQDKALCCGIYHTDPRRRRKLRRPSDREAVSFWRFDMRDDVPSHITAWTLWGSRSHPLLSRGAFVSQHRTAHRWSAHRLDSSQLAARVRTNVL